MWLLFVLVKRQARGWGGVYAVRSECPRWGGRFPDLREQFVVISLRRILKISSFQICGTAQPELISILVASLKCKFPVGKMCSNSSDHEHAVTEREDRISSGKPALIIQSRRMQAQRTDVIVCVY